MEVKGYKAFNVDKTNRYGIPFEEGETYTIEGPITFGNDGNGFHICTCLSDVFRFFDFVDGDGIVAEVTARGEHRRYDDEYNGYYDMYAFEEITIDRFLSREEIIEAMLKDHELNNKKFLCTFALNEQEKARFLRKYRGNRTMLEWILYYQYGFKDLYERSYQEKTEQIRMVLENGQDNN